MKKILSLFVLFVLSTSFVSFAQTHPGGPSGPGNGGSTSTPPNPDESGPEPGDVPPPVIVPIPITVPMSFHVNFDGTFLEGDIIICGSTVEIIFSHPLCISSIVLRNLNNGAMSDTPFNGVMRSQVILNSLSSNGMWDICVIADGAVYHAAVYVDWYQSMHECPMN